MIQTSVWSSHSLCVCNFPRPRESVLVHAGWRIVGRCSALLIWEDVGLSGSLEIFFDCPSLPVAGERSSTEFTARLHAGGGGELTAGIEPAHLSPYPRCCTPCEVDPCPLPFRLGACSGRRYTSREADGAMYLLDNEPYPEMMKRGTPQRKTVYRISLTLVKREATSAESGSRAPPFPRHQGASERPGSPSPAEGSEAEDEFEMQGSLRSFRTFSTGHLELGRLKVARKSRDQTCKLKSTPSKELVTLRRRDGASTRPSSMLATVDVESKNKRNWTERLGSAAEPKDQVCGRKSPSLGKDFPDDRSCPEASGQGDLANAIRGQEFSSPSESNEAEAPCPRKSPNEDGRSALRKPEATTKKNDSPKSPLKDEESIAMPSESDFSKQLISKGVLSVAAARDSSLAADSSCVDAVKQPPSLSLATDKRHPSLLRRSFSFSFRHWNGEVMRFKALSKEKHHGSSSCLARVEAGSELKIQKPNCGESPTNEKRNTLDVGEVLNKTDSISEQERWDRGKRKNRTLDNSDIHKLSENREMGKDCFITGGARSSSQEHKLFRFFSGIFSKRDGTSTPVTSPYGKSHRDFISKSNEHASVQKKSGSNLEQSSSESIDENTAQNGMQLIVLPVNLNIFS